MSCLLTSGIALECIENTGGIKNVHIGTFDETNTSFVLTAGEITTFTTTADFFTFKFRPQTASFSEELAVSQENGTKFSTQTLTMSFHKLDAAKRNTMMLLAKDSLHVIVESQNGDYWLMGKVNGANVTTTTAAVGQAYGDKNGYDVTLTALEPELAHPIDSAALPTFS